MSAECQRLTARRWTSHAHTTLGYIGPDGHFVAIGDIDGHGQPTEASEAYASRLVSAWNACAGLPLDEIGLLSTYRNIIEAQREDLLHMLLTALPYIEDAQADPVYKPGVPAKVVQDMRAVITKVTGKPA